MADSSSDADKLSPKSHSADSSQPSSSSDAVSTTAEASSSSSPDAVTSSPSSSTHSKQSTRSSHASTPHTNPTTPASSHTHLTANTARTNTLITVLLSITLVLALLALLAGGSAWIEGRNIQRGDTQQFTQLQQQLQQQITTQRQQQQQLESRWALAQQKQNQWQLEVTQQVQQLKQLRQGQRLRARWALLSSLIDIANIHLQVTHNPEQALRALEYAHTLLKTVQAPGSESLNLALTRDIAQIKRAQADGLPHLIATLDDINQQIGDLQQADNPSPTHQSGATITSSSGATPTTSNGKTTQPKTLSTSASPTTQPSTPQRITQTQPTTHGLSALWQHLSRFIEIRRLSTPMAPVLSAHELALVKLLISSRLIQAELALWQQSPAPALAHLRQAQALLRQYFSQNEQAHTLIQQLQTVMTSVNQAVKPITLQSLLAIASYSPAPTPSTSMSLPSDGTRDTTTTVRSPNASPTSPSPLQSPNQQSPAVGAPSPTPSSPTQTPDTSTRSNKKTSPQSPAQSPSPMPPKRHPTPPAKKPTPLPPANTGVAL